MPAPSNTILYHFTHIDHLASILQHGLFSDTEAQARELITHEAGDQGIKKQRQGRPVPFAPGGVVADYVPFYFAPRSPMLYVISKGGVATYTQSQDELVYLGTSVERLLELGLRPIFSRRNAALVNAEFFTDPAELANKIDWSLMKDRIWKNTDEDLDRKARRAAECLVHECVPPEAFVGVRTMTIERMSDVARIVDSVGVSLSVDSRPNWYY